MHGILIALSLLPALFILIVGLASALLFYAIGRAVGSKETVQYGYNLALSVDQHINAVLLGDPDETISGRTGRAILSGRAKPWVPKFGEFVDFLAEKLFGDYNHVVKSVEAEETPKVKELWSWIEPGDHIK